MASVTTKAKRAIVEEALVVYKPYLPMTARDLLNVQVRFSLFRLLGRAFPQSNMRSIRSTLPDNYQALEFDDVGEAEDEDDRFRYMSSFANFPQFSPQFVIADADSELELFGEAATSDAPIEEVLQTPTPAQQQPAAPANAASDAKLIKLEDELAKLREMIAAVVTKQDSFVMPAAGAGVPPPPPMPPMMGGMPPPGPGVPCASGGGPPPPPPPPPPLPNMSLLMPNKIPSMAEMIAKNRKGQKAAHANLKKGPSMADVLAGLGGVKLKTVERSPGGTIIRNSNPAPSTEPQDPAAMIAAALRKKFAHKSFSSPGSEANKWEERERRMKAEKEAEREKNKPQFGLHLLRKKTRPPLSPVQSTATAGAQ